MLGNQERRAQREEGDEPRVKAGVFEFYWEEESIVVWEFRPIDLVPVKQSSLSGFSGEVWSPLRRAGLKKALISVYSSFLQLVRPRRTFKIIQTSECCVVFFLTS